MLKRDKVIEFKRLRARDGDMIVIRDRGEDYRKYVMERIAKTIRADVMVVFVDRLSDVKLLSPDQLKRIGLKRDTDD